MEQFISSLDIPFHSDLGSRLLNALIQFHADEKHPERHNLRHKEDSAQVDKVFHEFLRKYGEDLFGTAEAQMQYPGCPVYKNTMSAADMMKSFRPIRSALLHLSKNWRQRKVREEEREKRMQETTLNAIQNQDTSSESGSNFCDDSQETASVIMPFKTRTRTSEHAAAAALPPTTPRLSSSNSSTMPSFTDRHVSSNSKPGKKRPSSALEEDEPLDSSSTTRTLQDQHAIRTLNPSTSTSKSSLSSSQTPSKPLKKHISVKLCVPNSRYQWIEWRYGALLSKLSIHTLFDGVAKSYGISNNDFTLRLLLLDARPEEKVLVLRREVPGDLKQAIEAITKIIETQSYQQGNFRVCMLPVAVEEEELEIEI